VTLSKWGIERLGVVLRKLGFRWSSIVLPG